MAICLLFLINFSMIYYTPDKAYSTKLIYIFISQEELKGKICLCQDFLVSLLVIILTERFYFSLNIPQLLLTEKL